MLTICKSINRSSTGFTLLELVLVILLISVLSSSIIPKLFNFNTFNQRFFVDQALSTLRYVQKLAVAQGCHSQVAIVGSALIVTQRVNCTSGSFTQAVTDPVSRTGPFVKQAPAGVSISSQDFPIYFDGLGIAYGASGSKNSYTINVGAHVLSIVSQTGFVYESS
jgi:MSHA pilin protein MshC